MNKAMKILIVDDEMGIRDLLSSELGSHDYQVSTATNGEEAVEKVKKEKFQLVISDIKMPRMNGLEMLEEIKKIDPDVEVIMSTGYGTIETAVHAMKKGAYDFVQKPFNLDEILALVEKALEKSELKTLLGIYESSKAIFSSMKLEVLLPLMVKLATQILKADDSSIMLTNAEGKLMVVAAVGLDGEDKKKARLALGQKIAEKDNQPKEPVIISGPLDNDPQFSSIALLREIRSSIVFPLIVEGELLGVLNANRTVQKDPFTAAELRHATIFGAQIAQALHNAKLYRELEKKILQIQEMQIQLVQSEKLAAVGQLAAGVAHEINNPLTGILGFAQMLLQSDSLTKEQREDLESIKHQSQRCRDIVQNLLKFSRRRALHEEDVTINKILRPTLELVQYDFKANDIQITTEVPDSLPMVHVDPVQLEQVFLNIIVNARQAMTRREGSWLKIKAFEHSDRIVIRFEDNGCGIPKENLNKVFDPFFTTKPVGQGTGLGLSISYGIIEQHHGKIYVESEVGAGSTFIIELPVLMPVHHEREKENIAH